ncbi:antizyme inhibitor 2-like [Temnothorax curvispinosus]|uniref:Antizyme inhibitor 2-like n=1 Tax=Temnothorax curvispinosus TaxID=300111 RepID=A0A6J1RDI2_9HYME|nr:antizyme inhibitor 2-like [Temnothorax curvispinosus]
MPNVSIAALCIFTKCNYFNKSLCHSFFQISAIKCNSNATVIKVLATLNACFDCESKEEIAQVRKHKVQGERIIFANPNKLPSHIKYAKEQGVAQMTVDNEIELIKIKELFPDYA